MNQQLLPSDVAAEQAVIGSILIDAAQFAGCREIIDRSDFYRETHAVVWEAMEVSWVAGNPVDQVTIGNILQAKQPDEPLGSLLAHIVGTTPSSVYATHYARIVRDHSRRRKIIDESQSIEQSSFNHESDIDEIASKMIEVGLEVAKAGKGKVVLRPVREFADDSFNKIHEVYDGGSASTGISTGFGLLDNYIGGLQGGRLYTVGARTSMGKTAVLVHMAQTMAKRGKRIAYYSLEESAEDLIGRMISIDLGFDWTRLDEPDRLIHRSAFSNSFGKVSDLPFWTTDAARLTTGEMHAQAVVMDAQDHGGVDALFVDYIHLAADSPNRESRVEVLDRVTRNLKTMSRELDVPVIAAAQLRRPDGLGALKQPTLTDLRESGGIEQNSDVVILLWRPWYFVERGMAEASEVRPPDWRGTTAELENFLKMIVAKNKHGPTGSIPLLYFTKSGRMGVVEDD